MDIDIIIFMNAWQYVPYVPWYLQLLIKYVVLFECLYMFMSRGAHYLAINYLYLHLTNSVLLATILIKYSMNGLINISLIIIQVQINLQTYFYQTQTHAVPFSNR